MDLNSLKLGYLVFGVRKAEAWLPFGSAMLGLPAPVRNDDGSLGFRVDTAAQRLIVAPGGHDDLVALGLELGDDDALDRLLGRLAGLGLGAPAAAAATVQARRVRRLHRLVDPAGNTVELCTGLTNAETPFHSTAFRGGFRTGELGLGHVVLVSHDLHAMERFYVDGLGFAVTERLATRLGPIALNGTFLHCNRRHHSLALFDLPLRKHIHHFMLEANDIADVGAAFERARRQVPLSLSLGQHPDPDGTFSFYGETPSGFDFEIGAGSKEIDPRGWQVQQGPMASTWGHKPKLRTQLKMAVEVLASKVAA
jgi:biphenyl-2,3-diol 1,2-dioxygenase